MKIVYDPSKRLINLQKHGFDFADLDIVFFDNAIVVPAKDNRFMAISTLRDGIIAVVFVTL